MITIVGNGAIGNLLALQCQNQGIDYQVISRTNSPEQIHCSGLLSTQMIKPKVLQQGTSIESGILILPLKAYQIVPCVAQLKSLIGPKVSLVLLHNGLGTHLHVKTLMPEHNIAVVTTSYGAFKPDKQHLTVTGIGTTQAGWLDSHPLNTDHQGQFSSILPPTTWHRDIMPMLWRKLTINAIINPLTAIFNVPNGELCNAQFLPQIRQLATEISAVMTLKKMPTSVDDIIASCLEVATATASNFSSMHQDIQYGRLTEVDFINGHIVKEAERLKKSVPFNQAIWQQIKKMEA